MNIRTRTLAVFGAIALVASATACNDDNENDITGPQSDRVYVQVERLGNPLVSEVLLAKRNHGFHNAGKPSTDVANHATELKAFIANVAGRDATVQNTLASVLLPDMLIVQTDKAASSAGWLTWALANGYGGRKLADDVVDAGLAAIFGNLISPNNVSVGLTTDNVSQNDKPFSTTFPYLAVAN
jgi:uncharacterized protein DUF4331